MDKIEFRNSKTRYEGNCQNCGEHGTLYDFRNQGIICWDCIKEGRKPLEELTAEKLRELIKAGGSGHPIQIEEPYDRTEIIKEIENRGLELLEDLGWAKEMEATYRNIHTGRERTLGELLKGINEEEINEHRLFIVVEHEKPAEGENKIEPKYLARKRGCVSLTEF